MMGHPIVPYLWKASSATEYSNLFFFFFCCLPSQVASSIAFYQHLSHIDSCLMCIHTKAQISMRLTQSSVPQLLQTEPSEAKSNLIMA